MKLQDLDLYQVKEAWEEVCKTTNTCPIRMRDNTKHIF